jgi:hypothetical protein
MLSSIILIFYFSRPFAVTIGEERVRLWNQNGSFSIEFQFIDMKFVYYWLCTFDMNKMSLLPVTSRVLKARSILFNDSNDYCIIWISYGL